MTGTFMPPEYGSHAARQCREGLKRGNIHEGAPRRRPGGRARAGDADGRVGRRSARAHRSAELVLPGQPDLERLPRAARARTTRIRASADREEVEGRARPDGLRRQAASTSRSRRAARSSARRRPRRTTSRAPTCPAFYRDFLNKPQALNHFQTMNRYWMEDSYGKYGVQLDAFGPYRLPGHSYQYFMTEFGGNAQPRALPGADAGAPVQPELPHRRARGVAGRRRRGRRSPSTTTSSTSPPARTSPPRGRSSAR